MSSISDDEADSIAPESSISQQAETSSVTTQSLPIPDPTSIGEYFIVKDTPECLEEALPFLRKGDKVYHFQSHEQLRTSRTSRAGITLLIHWLRGGSAHSYARLIPRL